jgi:hypothetical protein
MMFEEKWLEKCPCCEKAYWCYAGIDMHGCPKCVAEANATAVAKPYVYDPSGVLTIVPTTTKVWWTTQNWNTFA